MTAYLITMIIIHIVTVCATLADKSKFRTEPQRLGRVLMFSAFTWWGFTLLIEHLQKGGV